MTLSVCMIVRDEAPVLERCLDSLRAVWDELIVLDTGSTDETPEIARRYTDKVFFMPWEDDFAAARNRAFSYATGDWILSIDADEYLSPQSVAAMLELKQTLTDQVDYVRVGFRFSGQGERGEMMREKLVRRARKPMWKGRVCEYLDIAPDWRGLTRRDITIIHDKLRVNDPGRNLRILQALRASGDTSPRTLYALCMALNTAERYSDIPEVYAQLMATRESGYLYECLESYLHALKQLGRMEERLPALSLLLEIAQPTAYLCCQMGQWFLDHGKAQTAAGWYTLALHTPCREPETLSQHPGYDSWVPHLRLCRCYAALGNFTAAWEHNEKAAGSLPDSRIIEQNRRVLRKHLTRGDSAIDSKQQNQGGYRHE